MKDLFSGHADQYARFRPSYPATLFEYIVGLCPSKVKAWDCGTGNGQIAGILSGFFTEVHATDISQNQLDNAIRLPNIHYSQQPAEKTDFSENYFDLIVVAQAIHWFDLDKFYQEVNRTSKNGAILLVLGYGLLKINAEIDQVIDKLYRNILGLYWEPERKLIDERYQSIHFPFEELEAPYFPNEYLWSFEQLIGYLKTWSAVRKYLRITQKDPIELIKKELQDAWGEDLRKVEFPLLIRLGSLNKSE